jgi:hypothetical protein
MKKVKINNISSIEVGTSESSTQSSSEEPGEIKGHEHGMKTPCYNKNRPGYGIFDAFEIAERRQSVARELQQARVRQEMVDVISLEDELHKWREQCPFCVVRGRDETLHSFEACRQAEAEDIRERCRLLADGFRYESYAACYHCGIPQAICRRWVRGTKHKFAQQPRVKCQFPRHFHTVLVVVVSDFGSREMLRMLREWIRQEDGELFEEGDDKIELQRWGTRVAWGGIETSQLVRNFYRCATIIEMTLTRQSQRLS